MEGNGRRLAWVAIALSVVALIVSVGGRAQSHWQVYNESRGFYAAPSGPQSQFGPQGPQGKFGPQDQPGLQGQFGRHGKFGPQGPQDRFGPQGFGRRPFFLFPFMLIGGLLKLLFVGLLIWLGLRLISGRGFGGPWGRGRWGQGPSEQNRPQGPGPEQPPYPDDTQQV